MLGSFLGFRHQIALTLGVGAHLTIEVISRPTDFCWEFAGAGALGEEMAAFVGATLLLNHLPMAEAPQLESIALAGYLAGLREAGWDGATDLVWQAYRAAMPLRYALMSLTSMCRTTVEPDFARHWVQTTGKPRQEILPHRAEFVRFMVASGGDASPPTNYCSETASKID